MVFFYQVKECSYSNQTSYGVHPLYVEFTAEKFYDITYQEKSLFFQTAFHEISELRIFANCDFSSGTECSNWSKFSMENLQCIKSLTQKVF